MRVVSDSDQGKKRKNNEDSILVEQDKGIFLLADGMGGHQGGEVASKMAVGEALAHLSGGINVSHSDKDITKLLAESLFKANDVVFEKAKTDLSLLGMGSTLVQMVIKNDKAYICNVGDSRAYHVRDGIQQLTRDQTVGDYLVEHKIMAREDVPPQKFHTLTQAVGTADHLVPEQLTIDLKEGDYLLLCSDGLTDMLSDDQIKEVIIRYGDDLDEAVKMLIKEANNKGGRDNITVVLVRI
jgi:serine/threonine protein phosphatase PrpC